MKAGYCWWQLLCRAGSCSRPGPGHRTVVPYPVLWTCHTCQPICQTANRVFSAAASRQLNTNPVQHWFSSQQSYGNVENFSRKWNLLCWYLRAGRKSKQWNCWKSPRRDKAGSGCSSAQHGGALGLSHASRVPYYCFAADQNTISQHQTILQEPSQPVPLVQHTLNESQQLLGHVGLIYF